MLVSRCVVTHEIRQMGSGRVLCSVSWMVAFELYAQCSTAGVSPNPEAPTEKTHGLRALVFECKLVLTRKLRLKTKRWRNLEGFAAVDGRPRAKEKTKELTADLKILKRDFISSVYSFIVMLSICECVKIFSGDLNERGKSWCVYSKRWTRVDRSIGQRPTLHNATDNRCGWYAQFCFCTKSNLTTRFFLLSMASGWCYHGR